VDGAHRARYDDAMLLWLLACSSAQPPDVEPDIAAGPPTITSAAVICDVPSATWTFEVSSAGWTGNGDVRWSTDGVYLEAHPLYSVSAAADGSADRLELSLQVVADWRDAASGSRTAFNCEEPDLAGVLQDGAQVADCRAFGVAPERWATWDEAVACDTLLAPEDTGAAPDVSARRTRP
jgi:hypothetical protein